jgi:hypothetical protein
MVEAAITLPDKGKEGSHSRARLGQSHLWTEHLPRLCLLPPLQWLWEVRLITLMLQIEKLKPPAVE